MTDGALFDAPTGGTRSSGGDYFAVSPTAPLAARMRPRSLDEVAKTTCWLPGNHCAASSRAPVTPA